MAESAPTPSVALLFADAELGAHLREALQALSARIVHEGPANAVRREDLAAADVVVVNLDATVEDNFEQLYEVLDESRQRVVFNDAAASRGLSGWDRARWARHLAAKLLDAGDVDPPRPADARSIDATDAGEAMPSSAVETAVDAVDDSLYDPASAASTGLDDEAIAVPAADASETAALAAELEALLAEGDDLPADIGIAAASELELSLDPDPDTADDEATTIPAAADAPRPVAPEAPAGLSLVPQDDPEADPAAPALPVEQRQTEPVAAPVADWDLVDFDAEAPAPDAPAHAREFGIEKLAAAEFLAPEGGSDDSIMEPGLSLELESIEDAIAPRVDDAPVHEMHLGDGSGGIRRVLLLGAAAEGSAAVVEFLASLPGALPALVVLVQHQAGQSAEALADALAAAASLPVRAAADGMRARQGEVVVLPAGRQVVLGRDGSLSLQAALPNGPCDPSIDECFTAIAATFGADVVGIVFAGDANDAVAGAQAVHDRGGRVWAQDPATCQANAMITVAQEEGLVDFVGTPEELALRLREEYA
jgi:two-component system chemotaxis response regulator CheB/chemosensory pili system protein ChpB (putative protein-glutamate methylesterase)